MVLYRAVATKSDLFEVRANSENLVYEIFDRQDLILSESVLNDRVIG